jgi:hypothetical protein
VLLEEVLCGFGLGGTRHDLLGLLVLRALLARSDLPVMLASFLVACVGQDGGARLVAGRHDDGESAGGVVGMGRQGNVGEMSEFLEHQTIIFCCPREQSHTPGRRV